MSLMCFSIDTVNLKKKSGGGGSLFAFFHLYYLLPKFTPNPLAKEILANSSVVLVGSVLLWLSPCYRAGWHELPPSHRNGVCGHVLHGAKETRHWQEPEVRMQYRPLVLAEAERGKRARPAFSLGTTVRLPGHSSPKGMSGRWTHLPEASRALAAFFHWNEFLRDKPN